MAILAPGSRVVMIEPLVHPADSFAAKDLETFRKYDGAGYFGAYAVSDAGMPAHVTGLHSRAEAAASAIAWCRKNGGDRSCHVIAERLPFTNPEAGLQTMSERAAQGFREYQAKPGPKAFALGGQSDWASHYSGRPKAEAIERALANCRREFGVGPVTPGAAACRIIDAQD